MFFQVILKFTAFFHGVMPLIHHLRNFLADRTVFAFRADIISSELYVEVVKHI